MSLKHSLICCSVVLAISQTSFAKKITPQNYMAPQYAAPKGNNIHIDRNGATPGIDRQEPFERLIAKKQKLKTLPVPALKTEVAKLTTQYNAQHNTVMNLIGEISNHQSTVQKNLEEQASLLNNVIAHNQACIDSLEQELNELNQAMVLNIKNMLLRREPPFPGCPSCG